MNTSDLSYQVRQQVAHYERELSHMGHLLAVAITALEKYADPARHSMDPTGFVWSGDYFDYETAKKALDEILRRS